MKIRFKFATLAAIASLMISPLFGQGSIVPEVSYQAVIRDANGNLIGAETPVTYNIILKIWNSPSSNDPLDLRWAEQHQTTVSAGRFAVLMGQGSVVQEGGNDLLKPALDTVFNGDSRYVEISYTSVLNNPQASDFTAIQPRQLITPAAMALRAKTAELADQATEALSVADGGVTGGAIADGSVTGDDLADESIEPRHLSAEAKAIKFAQGTTTAEVNDRLVMDSENNSTGKTYLASGALSNTWTSFSKDSGWHLQEVPVSTEVPAGVSAIYMNLYSYTTGGDFQRFSFHTKKTIPTVAPPKGGAWGLDVHGVHNRSYDGITAIFIRDRPTSGFEIYFDHNQQFIIPLYEFTLADGSVRRGFWFYKSDDGYSYSNPQLFTKGRILATL